MFTINGTWEGKKTSIKWVNGAVVGPDTFVDAIEKMTTTFTPGPVPLYFDHPDITNPDMAATMIEFTLDTVTSSDGPEVDLSGEFYEGTDIAKHPGPRGSALHSTGTGQDAHGGDRISPLNRSLYGTENTMDAIAAIDPKLPGKVIANWERVTGESRRRIVNQYRKLLKKAQDHPDYESWKYWYDDVHDLSTEIGERNGFTTEQVAAAFSAFSPGINWDEELKTIPALAEMMSLDAVVPDEHLALVNEKLSSDNILNSRATDSQIELQLLEHGDKVSMLDDPRAAALAYTELARVSESHENWAIPYGYDPLSDAVAILRGGDIDETLRGVKTRSFYNNIIMPEDSRDVTIDFQMMEAAARRPLHKTEKSGGDGLPSFDGNIRDEDTTLGGTPSKKIRGYDGTATAIGVRPYLGDIVRQVATEFDLLPNQAQAIIWNQWKEEK